MKILITNDDGILSPALPILVREARSLGEVTVIAPKVEQSGKSHAIDFTRPIEIKPMDIFEGARAFSMDSTPADCVRFGVLGLLEKFDLIISGVNRGYNLGADIVYSGTVGAIFEGARLGIPGIAISSEPNYYTTATEEIGRLFTYVKERRLFEQCSYYNVNIPPKSRGYKITKQGGIYFTDSFERREGDIFVQVGGAADHDLSDESEDITAMRAGFVSITPLLATRTDMNAFEKLK